MTGEAVAAVATPGTAGDAVQQTLGQRLPLTSRLRGPKAAAAIFFFATSAVNLLTFGFHLLFSRSLGPRDYGALGALLAVIIVLAVPLGAIQLASARASALADRTVGTRTLIQRWAVLGVVVFVLMAAFAPLISHFLKLPAVLPAIYLAGWLAFAASSASAQGVLVGQSRLASVAFAVLAGSGAARLAFGIVFSEAHLGVSGAMGATLLGQAVTYALLLRALAPSLGPGGSQLRLSIADGALSVGALSGFALFGSIDDILARHLLAGVSGGYYVAAATAGRIALFVPGSIALIAFPSFNANGAARSNRTALVRSFTVVSGLGAIVGAVMAAFPGPTIRVLFGAAFSPAQQSLPLLAFAGAILGCLNLTTYFHLAHRSWWALLGWGGSGVLTVLVYVMGITGHRLAVIAISVAAGTAGLSLAASLRYGLRGHREPDPAVDIVL